jgi:membrane protein YdbS with pleckstrin-like domain
VRVLSQLTKNLRTGENVLWSGKPVKTPFIIPGLATVLFGLLFLGFSIFWMWGATSAGAPLVFTLFELPFILMGLGLTVGPTIWQLMRYRNTEYMITDQRMITQTGAIGLDTRFVDLDKVQEVYVQVGFIDKMLGTGSIFAVTAGQVYVDMGGAGCGWGGPRMRPSLAALKEPYEVQKLLQEAIVKVRQPKS